MVTTTTIVERICGTMTRQKICRSVAPSMRAASMMSSGTPLIAAESSTIANPACSQIMMTISSEVVEVPRAGVWIQAIGSNAEPGA